MNKQIWGVVGRGAGVRGRGEAGGEGSKEVLTTLFDGWVLVGEGAIGELGLGSGGRG
jgi:hypothetical protein